MDFNDYLTQQVLAGPLRKIEMEKLIFQTINSPKTTEFLRKVFAMKDG